MPGKQEKAQSLLHNLDSILGSESSVELVHTTKGITWKVKVYHSDTVEALRIANNIFKECSKKYGQVTK